uniref:L-threonine 3-dehydrogenase, mitochondrial n=1 Tax=Panagrellus redivivus TaxID=6233 RepID=A0A7E4W128_PANRE
MSSRRIASSLLTTPAATTVSSVRFTQHTPKLCTSSSDPRHRFHQLSQHAPAPKVLITGGLGQLGRSLANVLKYMYGPDSVVLSDIARRPAGHDHLSPFCYINILDKTSVEAAVVNNNIDTLIHFSALLSAVGESNVPLALKVNGQGVENVLEVARTYNLKVFIPSTIGAFGPTTPRDGTPDITVQRPRTIYGVTKVYAELLGEYYFERFGTDFRSLRFPGVISDTNPGGGTTDYAIQIFYDAILKGSHECYLRPDTELPMVYDTDCMTSVIQLLLAPAEKLSLRTYNIQGFSFTPEQIAAVIRKRMPEFEMTYKVCPMRQKIADSWPRSLDDTNARHDWNWDPKYDLEKTADIMFELLTAKLLPPQPKLATL